MTIAKTTKLGAHTVVAKAADGTSSSAHADGDQGLRALPGPARHHRAVPAWLIALLTGNAC